MSATYDLYTSPHHPPVPEHLPTLIVTPHGRPQQVLYTYLHTNVNTENYLLTPSADGDLCVAKLYPPDRSGSLRGVGAGASSNSHGSGGAGGSVRCVASRGLSWRVAQTGIQNPVYKILLPNPEMPGEHQPLFQVSKPNPNAPYWTCFYFSYAGHLIPPKRVEFGRISQNGPEGGGGTRLAITGRTDEEKAVWASLGPGNEDAVEWLVVCAALVVLDDEIASAAERSGLGYGAGPAGAAAGAKPRSRPPSPQKSRAGGAMRVVAPVEMQSGVPRSASSSNLVPAAPGPGPASRGPSPRPIAPPQRPHEEHPDARFLPPQQQPQQYAPPVPQQQHGPAPSQQPRPDQQRYHQPHPDSRQPQPQPHPDQQRYREAHLDPQQQQQQQQHDYAAAPPSQQPGAQRVYAPPPRSSSNQAFAAPAQQQQQQQYGAESRVPSGYRAGSRPVQPQPQPLGQGHGYGAPPSLGEYGGGDGGEMLFPGQGGQAQGQAQGQRVKREGEATGRRLTKERR